MKIVKTRIGPNGRLQIPHDYLESLNLKVNDFVFLLLDEQNKSLRVSQFDATDLYEMLITMNDKPGTLAWLATVLYEHHFDLVFTEAHSIVRTKGAWWRVIGTFKGKPTTADLKKDLLKNGATSVTIIHL
ncbi:Uncharacterised protein [Candidatus Bilamarchaeum dharawalense]|uniref:SpoVT-AbrB domain-containing protein n=1 Tax=Candidatus Bilamarchaeum dharawalense TaxID=2885759 RepID=A0A5E4LVL3_9ARCH|nr:Uncharacterised protein [Candidatus Bilamarchaeum dharawalense]